MDMREGGRCRVDEGGGGGRYEEDDEDDGQSFGGSMGLLGRLWLMG